MPATDRDLDFATTLELTQRMAGGEVSPVEVLDHTLDRIARLDPQLNSFVEVFTGPARGAAAESERRFAAGTARPLEGLPIPIKDNTVIAGSRLGLGSRISPPFEMPVDSEIVARLRAAGAVIVGRTTLPEFGTIPSTECDVTGRTHNPWNLDYSPGGSSGGSAAAVAAGMVPAAHGNDGGGSLRVPASNCGLFTLKPTRGSISRAPLDDDLGFNIDGVLTRTVADNARLLDILLGSIPGDFYHAPEPSPPLLDQLRTPPGRLRIAWTATPPVATDVPADLVAAVRRTAELCADLGHEVVEATPDWQDDQLADSFLKVWSSLIGGGIEYLTLLGGGTVADVEPHNRALHTLAAGLDANQLKLALITGLAYARRVMGFYNQHDVLLTPTLGVACWRLGEAFAGMDVDPLMPLVNATPVVAFTAFCNLSGQPAVSLPMGESGGLPVGVQAAGRLGEDGLLLRLAAQIEEAAPWASRRPPLAWASRERDGPGRAGRVD